VNAASKERSAPASSELARRKPWVRRRTDLSPAISFISGGADPLARRRGSAVGSRSRRESCLRRTAIERATEIEAFLASVGDGK